MTKFSIKKIAVAALSALGLSALTFGAAGCLPKSTGLSVPENVEISRSEPPADGSLPTAHTCAENLSYIIYVFDNQPQYHTYSYGVTAASIATQTTRNFRDYKDGILMNTDLTYSSMVKSGTQTCSMYNGEGEYEVYFRTSAAPEADTLPSQAVWSEDAPTFFNEKSYNYTYGLLPNELFNYIVNEENIIDSEQIKVNGDGTYTQNFTLDPVASTYYYQFGMKTRGGLSGYPEFESITFAVTFDAQWQIKSAKMHEVSKVNKGIVVTSISDFETQYWYGDDHFDEAHYAFYNDYFKNYIDDSEQLEQGGPVDDKLTIDVTNVLSNGFSQIMNGGAQFGITANLGANRYVGYVYLSLDLEDIPGTLALKASLGKTLKEQTLYIEYGNDGLAAYYGKDFALGANLSEVKAQFGELSEIIENIKSAFAKSGETAPGEEAVPALQTEGQDPLTALMDSMVLVADEKQAVLTLDTDDLLGLGIGINARLVFGINNNKITFRSASIGDLAIGGEKLDLSLNLSTTTASEINRVPSETGANLADYVADVHKLLGADLIKVTVGLDGNGEKVSIDALKGLTAEITAYADIDGVTVGAEADVSYTYKEHTISAKADIWYGYDTDEENYGKAIVSLTEFNGKPLNFKVKCDVKEVVEAVSTLVTFGGADGSEAAEGLVSILNGALSSDLSKLLTEMYADKAQIKVGVSIDDLLGMLGVDTGIKFGSCTLKYARGAEDDVYGGALSAALPALGLEIEVCGEGGAVTTPDDTDCLDLIYVIDDVKSVLNADLIKAEISLDGSAEGVTVKELDGVKAELTAYFDPDGLAVAADIGASYEYKGNTVSAKLTAYYEKGENKYGEIILNLTELNGYGVSVNVYCNIDNVAEAVKTLLNNANVTLPSLGTGSGADLDEILTKVIAADITSLLPTLETSGRGAKIAVDVDNVLDLFGVNTGLAFGTVSLAYNHGGNEPLLTAVAPALGLSVNIDSADGTVTKPDSEICLDLNYVIEDVKSLVEAQLIKAEISLDGGAEGVTVKELDGVKAELTAYLDVDGLAVAADAEVSYTYDEKTISAALTVYYEKGDNKYGEIVLSLTKLNGKQVNANVYCNIDSVIEAVKTLLGYANVQLAPFEKEGGTDLSGVKLDDVLTRIITADLSALLPKLETSGSGARIAVDVDGVLDLFEVNTDLTFGEVGLAYNAGKTDELLTAKLPALGLSVNVGASDKVLKKPDVESCFDLTGLVNTVNAVWEQVNGIIDNRTVAFKIGKGETYLSIDGITVVIWGDGEVSWKKGGEYVALDLSMSITETGTDVTTLKLIYDKNADGTPLVRLALNGIGIDIYQNDIDGVVNGFNRIYDKIKPLLGGGSDEQVAVLSEEDTSSSDVEEQSLDTEKLLCWIFGELSSDGWVSALNDFTLTTDGKSVALGYLADNSANVRIGADGCLSLYYDGAFGRLNLGGSIEVTSASGGLIDAISSKLEDCKMLSSKTEGSSAFVKLAYDFLFESISNIPVKNILGSNTYTVKFELVGENTNIEQLQDVFIDAQIYVSGETKNAGKLAEGYLNIDAAGVVIKLHVITERKQNDTHFYINLSQVMDIKLPDLKFLATQESLYDTFKVLFKTLNDTDILDVIGGMIKSDDVSQPEEGEGAANADSDGDSADKAPVITQSQLDKIVDILSRLLEFDFGKAVEATEADDEMTAYIDLDGIVKQFGVEDSSLGVVKAVINHRTHSMKTSGTANVKNADGTSELKEWIWLSSEVTERRSYEDFERSDYISIKFLPTLIEDLVKTITDENGNMYNKITLSGTVNLNLVSLIEVELQITTLTVNPDGENGFYLSLIANLSGGMVTNGTIGLTYQNGYLTLGRYLSTAKPEYRLMTFEYFLDNMFAKGSNSTLNWLLGVNNTLWNTVRGKLGELANIDSGLTTPEQVYLYKANVQKETSEISMYDYVNALSVIISGNQTAVFGNYSVFEDDLGVYDNYYGFSLNAGKITNGILTKLNAAITRNESGLDAVIAKGAIQSYVTFGANLKFKNDWSEDYVIGTSNDGGKTAPSLYDIVVKAAADNNKEIEFEHNEPKNGYDETFGCLWATCGGGDSYSFSTDYSHVLYSHDLEIYNEDGDLIETRRVRHGSTVYLYDNDSPLYTDSTKEYRVLYSTSKDAVGAASVEMNGDLKVYKLIRKAVNVIAHSGSEQYTVTSFDGDAMPTKVTGYETIGTPSYDPEGTQPVGATDKVSASGGAIHIYGTFVNTETEVNFVKYTFSAQTMSYTASGKAAGFNDYYSVKGNTLVLESYIGGYPVKAIGDGAFANTEEKPIKNVIVPETIVTVGENAFLDNIGMESAVFLADNVYFSGTNNKDYKSTPFYGCSTASGGKTTSLRIYYNNIEGKYEGDGGNYVWACFRTEGSISVNYYYVGIDPNTSGIKGNYNHNGGGALYGNGTWCMLDVEVAGADTVEELDFNGLVNANVTGGFNVGSVYSQTDAEALAATLSTALSQYRNAAGDSKYVVNVNLTASSSSHLKLAVRVLLNVPAEITVYSDLAMTYNGMSVAAKVQSKVYTTAVGSEYALTAPASADGSLFLGWAVEKNGGLEFVGQQAEANDDTVFYAIWGKSKVNAEVMASINYSGSKLANPTSGNGKWYDDNWNEVTTISENNTVVYTRSTFTFTYTVSGNGAMKISDSLHNVSKKDMDLGAGYKYTNSFDVLEGQIVEVKRTDNKVVDIYVDGVLRTTLTLSKWNLNNKNFNSNVSSTQTIGKDESVTIKYGS